MTASDDDAFRSYALSRQRALRRAAYLMCGDWHLADDLVQSTLTKLYATWHRITVDQGPDAYAHRILANVTIDERRRPWRREVGMRDLPESETPSAEAQSAARMDLVDALAQLPPGQRLTLVLRFWIDLSVADTAEAMDCSPGTVKSQTTKGLSSLRSILGPDSALVTAGEEYS
jgi:RNA polymerase sigma-70 factor (sigma-E family)